MVIYYINWYFWFSLVSLIIAILALALAGETWRKLRYLLVVQQTSKHSHQLTPSNKGGSVYVIYNPSKKFDFQNLKTKISAIAANTGMEEPIWLATTREDSGYSMGLKAVEANAGVVITAGGDGTVRAVSSALSGSGIPMGILPVGTTNLLARNLRLPINNLDESIQIALTGRNRQIDIGWMKIINGEYSEGIVPDSTFLKELTGRDDIDSGESAFLIMAGIGFDGDIMASVEGKMKSRVGWFAYVFSGLKNLRRERMGANLTIGSTQESSEFLARSVLFANCGQLPHNILLLPDAQIDDGWLEIAVIDIKSKIFGWISLAIKVILQGIGIKTKIPKIVGKLDILRTHKAHLTTDKKYNVQIDGEYMGKAKELKVRIQSGALIVRTV
ncbi:NAD(+)/NADH kinase [Actinomyces sp. zg-332]|uniref:diacylglycerol/lipid kinase family protein n=1 Tax=Actinomyces sp. zg-332 TaxID=2708340 RepID=UPI0014205371|nr:diacylglycerol kinase family protein [Actinomyces sp. zg-332]QPK94074.1 NAD(+)/NADH kinase [Actinomyces sp. zg-332]